jgi:hypothetical protein
MYDPRYPSTLTPDLERLDQISREHWSVIAALSVKISMSRAALLELLARGADEFERIARREFDAQDFHQEDYQRMFEVLRRSVDNPGAALSVLHE